LRRRGALVRGPRAREKGTRSAGRAAGAGAAMAIGPKRRGGRGRAWLGAGGDGGGRRWALDSMAHTHTRFAVVKKKSRLGKSDGARAVGDGVEWRTSAGERQVGVAGGVAGGAVGKPAREG
jgi:hypothetical protein